ncbi:hypothetical protein E4U43_000103 [Claviceps pusilla]|uniref:DNA polymerase delta subunit 4 n=1 Tax=Claviceps pusilla TaxID=123648 RepID=A0A9P7NAR5_9HYPO|nr:hypothetical protein E4U43_000103 [Claviceps pusilla]
MPTTRRSAGAARGRTGPPSKGQSTISFANKVTKPIPKDVKKSLVTAPHTTRAEVAERTKPSNKKAEKEEEGEKDDDVHKEHEVQDIEPEDEHAQPPATAASERSEAEIRAEKVTDAHINSYWMGIERERKAPRVHQQGLSVHDKVLRYFDVSSQYGPCIGIDRTKRWERAERLGLKPPIEVLAVLLKERKRSNGEVETAQMDSILSAIAVGS